MVNSICLAAWALKSVPGTGSSVTGSVLPADSLADATFMYMSTHLSRRISNSNLYFVTEFNWYNYLTSGGGGLPGIEGGDLISLGSTNVTGKRIVTGAFGFKVQAAQQYGTRHCLGILLTSSTRCLLQSFNGGRDHSLLIVD